MKNKILLHFELKKQLQKEFACSMQTVDMSLKYVFDSQMAKAIRQRAKKLLIQEANRIEY